MSDQREEADKAYSSVKPEAGVPSVWPDIQTKVKQHLMASDLSQCSTVSFLHFLDLLHRLHSCSGPEQLWLFMVDQDPTGMVRVALHAPAAHYQHDIVT